MQQLNPTGPDCPYLNHQATTTHPKRHGGERYKQRKSLALSQTATNPSSTDSCSKQKPVEETRSQLVHLLAFTNVQRPTAVGIPPTDCHDSATTIVPPPCLQFKTLRAINIQVADETFS